MPPSLPEPAAPRGHARVALALLLACLSLVALAALRGQFAEHGATLAQLLPADEAHALEERLAPFGRSDDLCLVVLEGTRPWTDARVAALVDALAALPGVDRAAELGDWARLAPTPGVRVLGLWSRTAARELAAARALEAALAPCLAAASGPDQSADWVGLARLRTTSWELARAELLALVPALALLALGLPWLFLGSLGAGLFALLAAATTSAAALWALRLADGPLNPLALLAVPLVWAIATSDALHLAARARSHAGRGASPRAAVAGARAELWAPCALTTATTAAGLAGLALSAHSPLVRALGWTAAAGTLMAHPLTFHLLAPLARVAARAGRAPRWPRALGLRAVRTARSAPRRVLVAWGLACGVALLAWPALRVASPYPRVFAPGVPLERTLEELGAALGSDLAPLEVVVSARDAPGHRPEALASAVLAVARELHAFPEVRLVLPVDALPADALRAAAGEVGPSPTARGAAAEALLARPELAPWVVPDRGLARLEVHRTEASWDRTGALLARLEHLERAFLSHHALAPAGPAALAWRAEALGLTDLAGGAVVSGAAIVLALVLGLRSLRAAALALLASLVPLGLVAGLLGALGTGWSVALLPLPGVLFGIALDDSIHLLWRPRGRPRLAALPACLTTTAVLAACVATLGWSDFRANRTFGLLLAAGLVLALAADLTLLPVLRARSWRRGGPRA